MLVKRIDSIILSENDLPGISMTSFPIRGPVKEPPCTEGLRQSWDGNKAEEHIAIHYWLFNSIEDAEVAADKWRYAIASGLIKVDDKWESPYRPEAVPDFIFGDKTWRSGSGIWFVQKNVLVYVMGRRPVPNQIDFTKEVASKIEKKITAVVSKR